MGVKEYCCLDFKKGDVLQFGVDSVFEIWHHYHKGEQWHGRLVCQIGIDIKHPVGGGGDGLDIDSMTWDWAALWVAVFAHDILEQIGCAFGLDQRFMVAIVNRVDGCGRLCRWAGGFCVSRVLRIVPV